MPTWHEVQDRNGVWHVINLDRVQYTWNYVDLENNLTGVRFGLSGDDEPGYLVVRAATLVHLSPWYEADPNGS